MLPIRTKNPYLRFKNWYINFLRICSLGVSIWGVRLIYFSIFKLQEIPELRNIPWVAGLMGGIMFVAGIIGVLQPYNSDPILRDNYRSFRLYIDDNSGPVSNKNLVDVIMLLLNLVFVLLILYALKSISAG